MVNITAIITIRMMNWMAKHHLFLTERRHLKHRLSIVLELQMRYSELSLIWNKRFFMKNILQTFNLQHFLFGKLFRCFQDIEQFWTISLNTESFFYDELQNLTEMWDKVIESREKYIVYWTMILWINLPINTINYFLCFVCSCVHTLNFLCIRCVKKFSLNVFENTAENLFFSWTIINISKYRLIAKPLNDKLAWKYLTTLLFGTKHY